MDTTDLIFVRHGESLQNRGDVGADGDPGLTELGWRQSQLVADWLPNNYHADALLSSPLRRAVQTAELISRRMGLRVILRPGLEEAEQSYWAELPASHQSAPLALWDDVWIPSHQNAPIYTAFRARLREAMESIIADCAGKTAIIVAHGGSIGTILRSLFTGHALPIFTQNTGITHVAWKDGHWQLVSHNLQEHLAPLMGRSVPCPTSPGLPFPWSSNGVFRPIQDHYRRVAQLSDGSCAGSCPCDIPALVQTASATPAAVVLDVGCGAGDVALAFAPHVGRVIGVDVTPAMLERAELARIAVGVKNLELIWADAADLPVDGTSVDIVTVCDLLHLLEDPGALIAEAGRVLKPAGALLIDEPVGHPDPVTRATRDAIEVRRNAAFRRLLTHDEIAHLLTSAGWIIEVNESYVVRRKLENWLTCAAAEDGTRAAVRQMVEAGMDTDAAGLQTQRSRDGHFVLSEQRARLRARPPVTGATLPVGH